MRSALTAGNIIARAANTIRTRGGHGDRLPAAPNLVLLSPGIVGADTRIQVPPLHKVRDRRASRSRVPKSPGQDCCTDHPDVSGCRPLEWEAAYDTAAACPDESGHSDEGDGAYDDEPTRSAFPHGRERRVGLRHSAVDPESASLTFVFVRTAALAPSVLRGARVVLVRFTGRIE